jgi:hypothetical protein
LSNQQFSADETPQFADKTTQFPELETVTEKGQNNAN